MNKNKVLRLVAFIIALIKTIVSGIFLVPLIWRIPLTKRIYRSFKDGKSLSMGYNACIYVFLSNIAGLLLIIDGAFEAHGRKKLLVYIAYALAYVKAVRDVFAIIPCFWTFAVAYTFERLYNENTRVGVPTKVAMFFFAPLISAILLLFAKKEGKVIKFGQIDDYNPVLLFNEPKAVQKLTGFKMWFVKNNLLKLVITVGKFLWFKVILGIGRFFQDLVLTFVNGTWKTRISYYIMGFGSFARGQWLRGLLFFGFQAIFIGYMAFYGFKALGMLGSLGMYTSCAYDADTGVEICGDNSFTIMLYGVLTLFFIAAFFVTWYFNIKQNKVNDMIENDVKAVEHHKYISHYEKMHDTKLRKLIKALIGIRTFFGLFTVVRAFLGAYVYHEFENSKGSKLYEKIVNTVITFLFVSKLAGFLMLLDLFINEENKEAIKTSDIRLLQSIAGHLIEVHMFLRFFLVAPLIIGAITLSMIEKKKTGRVARIVLSILNFVCVDWSAGILLLVDAFTRKYEPLEEGQEAYKKIPTTKDDLRAMVDKNFHTTLLSIPTVGILMFTVLPIFFMILVAFTNYDGNHDPMAQQLFGWVGFQNFGKLLTWTGGDGSQFAMTFGQILLWTLVWAFFATFTNYFIGMLIAMLINKKGIKLKKLWRTILVFSIAVPQFISLMFVSNMFSDSGIFNTLYLNIMQNIFHATNVQPIPFWTDPWLARTTVILINIWIGVPYLMLVVTGILMNIPADLYESANIDGANPAQQYMKITLPYMLFITGPYLLTSFTGNMNNFNVIYLLSGGGPRTDALSDGEGHIAGSTDLLITWLFSLASTDSNYKLASVIGIMVFIVVSVLSLVVYNLIPSTKNEEEFQ